MTRPRVQEHLQVAGMENSNLTVSICQDFITLINREVCGQLGLEFQVVQMSVIYNRIILRTIHHKNLFYRFYPGALYFRDSDVEETQVMRSCAHVVICQGCDSPRLFLATLIKDKLSCLEFCLKVTSSIYPTKPR